MKNLTGVYQTTKKNGEIYYRSSITFKGRHISLGSFDDETNANGAYLEADLILKNTAITIHTYKAKYLKFDKTISLFNFRDNGLYFAVPIYIYKNFFHYYLSPSIILTFDMDDLFYYARHKIMKRGNHFFVADYGMQITITNRYGIKNYAVSGKDYRFINGDCYDFRSHNIEIFSRYHGVSPTNHKGIIKYKAKIHINGDYIVGTYDKEELAAIAYNKAVDLLKSNGLQKNYPVNYIETISQREYAELYTKLKISQKLSKLNFTTS